MKDYIINENGVCLNPDVMLKYDDKDIYFLIEGMENKDGSWSCGHDMQMGAGSYYGSLSPIIANWQPQDKDECIKREVEWFRRAIDHEMNNMIKYGDTDEFGNHKSCTRGVNACKRAIQWAERQLSPNQQLTFDFL